MLSGFWLGNPQAPNVALHLGREIQSQNESYRHEESVLLTDSSPLRTTGHVLAFVVFLGFATQPLGFRVLIRHAKRSEHSRK